MARVVVLLLLVIAANEDCCGGQTLEPEPEYDPFYLPPLKSYSSPDVMPNVASRQEVVYPPVLPLLVKRSAEEETEGYESEAVEADDSLLAHSRFKRVGPLSGNGPASEHGRVPGSECPFFASEMEKNAVRDKMRELQDHTVKRRGKPAKPWDKGCPTFQKDLLLTLDQINTVVEEVIHFENSTDFLRKKRQLTPFLARKWDVTNPVQFLFDDSMLVWDETEKNIVRTAFREWATMTCLDFTEATTAPDEDYIGIRHADYSGCWTNVGRQSPASNITIGIGCLQRETLLHEIGHVLGMFHEHTRPDRDDFVDVSWDNIRSGEEYNYEIIYEALTLGVPYDYGSLQHYRANEFSIDESLYTLTPLDMALRNTMGQRRVVSFRDAELINMHYCPMACGDLHSTDCVRGGVLNPNTCNCLCPSGFSGDSCELLAASTGSIGCGGQQLAPIVAPASLTYDATNQGDSCYWYILAPPEKALEFVIRRVGTAWYGEGYGCGFDYVEIKLDSHLINSGVRFCGYNNSINEVIQSETREALIIMDLTAGFGGWFELTYQAVDFDCEWMEWSEWSSCSGSCGCGMQQRTRTGDLSTEYCGSQPTSETRHCTKVLPCRETNMGRFCCPGWSITKGKCRLF